MLLRNVFITIALLLHFKGYTQHCDYLKLWNEKQKKEAFTIKDTARAELLNNRLNIALLLSKMDVFEINNIAEGLLKDTSLVSKDVKLVLISGQKNCTYESNGNITPVSLKITCKEGAKPGTKFRIYVEGKLYCNEQYYRVKLRVSGKVPAPLLIRTY